jgi:hypothetical protein
MLKSTLLFKAFPIPSTSPALLFLNALASDVFVPVALGIVSLMLLLAAELRKSLQ